jgi:hypothetical protein
MAIVKTIIRVPSIDGLFNVPGEWTAAQIQSMYAQQIPGVQNMTSTVTETTGPEGTQREITFAPRTGNKG